MSSSRDDAGEVAGAVDPYRAFTEGRIKHLDMIQAVVSRLAGNSFAVKGWALTVAGAFLGFAVSRREPRLALLGLLPVIVFWGLDAYFLQAERMFRALHERVREHDEEVPAFFMAATDRRFVERVAREDRERLSWRATWSRPTLVAFYGALVLAAVLIAVTTRGG
jgi:hypothetical protein